MNITEEQRQILLEYATWYDSHLDSPENLVNEFIEQREKTDTQKDESNWHKW